MNRCRLVSAEGDGLFKFFVTDIRVLKGIKFSCFKLKCKQTFVVANGMQLLPKGRYNNPLQGLVLFIGDLAAECGCILCMEVQTNTAQKNWYEIFNNITCLHHKNKTMSKLVLFSLMFAWATFLVAQPCTPNQNLPGAGIFPAKLDDANVNVQYEQVIQFKAPRDTSAYVPQLGTTLPVEVDSIRVMDVLGLPPGMSYACHNASCMVDGGEVGCLLISGTCSVPGGYPLQVIIKTSAKAIIGATKIPQSQIDTNTRYGVFVNWPTGIAQVIENAHINIYPNPAGNQLTIEGGVNSPLVSCTLYDMMGKKITTHSLSNDRYTHSIDITGLDKGMYMIEVNTQEQTFTKRFMKE